MGRGACARVRGSYFDIYTPKKNPDFWAGGSFRRRRSEDPALLAAAHNNARVARRWELDSKGERYKFLIFVSCCVLTMPIVRDMAI